MSTGEDAARSQPAVGIWVDYWLPSSQTFIVNQMKAMQRWQPVTIGLTALPDGIPSSPDLTPFTRSFSSRMRRRVLGTRGHVGAYTDLLRERRVQVLHAHFGPGAINLLPIARRCDLPLVVTFHGYDVTRLPRQPGARGRLYRRGLQAVFDRADCLVAVSGHVRERLLDLGAPGGKIAVRYVGAPAPSASEAVHLENASERAGITFVGRLVEKKGVEDLLAAVAILPTHLRPTPVLILGTGEQEVQLQRLAARFRVNAVFRGQVAPQDVAAALASAAVFCGPSKTARDGDTEGLPTTLIEAAHHGATIVSTRHAGIPEFARDGVEALLVDEGDVVALSAALTRALTDRELAQQLAARARARAMADFESASCTAALEALYDDLAEGTRPSSG